LATDRATDFRLPDVLFEQLPANVQHTLKQFAGSFYRVVGTVSSVDKSIRKMDMDAPCDYGGVVYDKAVSRVRSRYLEALNVMPFSFESIAHRVNMRASPGVPWSKLGFGSKGDVLKHPDFFKFFVGYLENPRGEPVWKVAPKIEWYDQLDILEDKVRTFIIPPVHFMLAQMYLFQNQNENMKMFSRSAYGFNPYNGGVNRIARRLEQNGFFACWDVKGWDRLLPILEDVYKLRIEKYIGTRWERLARFLADKTVRSNLILPDGTVIYKQRGNNSGSGETTTDNILAHEIIFEYLLLEAYPDGDNPRLAEYIRSLVVCYIFGDDIIASFPCLPHDFEGRVRSVYRRFGLELDPFRLSQNLEDMDFLGFYFRKLDIGWIPRFKVERLVASFCYSLTRTKDVSVAVSKAWTLTVMAAGDPSKAFDYMRQALSCYRKLLANSDDPTVRAFVDPPLFTRSDCFKFFLGLEQHSLVADGIKVFPMSKQGPKAKQQKGKQQPKVAPKKKVQAQASAPLRPSPKLNSAKPLVKTMSMSHSQIPRNNVIQGLRGNLSSDKVQSNLKKKSPWFSSIMDPLHGADCKIPDGTGVETGTLQSVFRTQVTINPAGCAAVRMINPLPFGGTGANLQVASAAGATTSTISWSGATDSTFESTATLGQFAQGVRVVSACVCAQSEASLANNGGVMIGYTYPWDASSTVTSVSEYQNRYKAATVPNNNNKPCFVRWYPVKMSTHDAGSGSILPCDYETFWEPTATDIPPWEMGIIFQGCNAGAVFEILAVVNYEFIPISNALNILDTRPSPTDAMEVDLVENWVQDMNPVAITSTAKMAVPPATVAPQHGEEQTGFGMFADVVKEIIPFAMSALALL